MIAGLGVTTDFLEMGGSRSKSKLKVGIRALGTRLGRTALLWSRSNLKVGIKAFGTLVERFPRFRLLCSFALGCRFVSFVEFDVPHAVKIARLLRSFSLEPLFVWFVNA